MESLDAMCVLFALTAMIVLRGGPGAARSPCDTHAAGGGAIRTCSQVPRVHLVKVKLFVTFTSGSRGTAAYLSQRPTLQGRVTLA